MQNKLIAIFMLMLGGLPLIGHAAEGGWYVTGTLQGMYGDYSGSIQRRSTSSEGLTVKADYLDKVSVNMGLYHTNIDFKNAIDDISQDAIWVSGQYHLNPDKLNGKVTLRLDGHFVTNDDSTNDTDDVVVAAPQISYINYAKTFYVDLGYAYSDYRNDLAVHQLTPTVGFALNQGADWVQLRGYLIDPSNTARAQGKEQTSAVEAKWTHWFGPKAILGIDSLQASTLIGRRVYAVDVDSNAVYNLADVQTGSAAVSGHWKFGDDLSLLVLGGVEKYENYNINDKYKNQFIYMNISKQW